MKVIFDTDPGIDDAMALLYLNAIPKIDLLGITTILGNASTETCTRNALILAEHYGISAPVYRGAERNIEGLVPNEYPDFVHGANGLGGLELPTPTKTPENVPAFEYLVEAVNRSPGEITILAVGRLTNLALAIRAQKGFQDRVKDVVIMGGSISARGNVTQWAEANIFGDPEAADIVFRSQLQVTLVGLDVTNTTRMSMSYIDSLVSNLPDLAELIIPMNSYYAEFYKAAEGTDDFPVHDSSAAAFLDDASLFKTRVGQIECIIEGAERGRTVFRPDDSGRHQVCLEVDSNRLLQNYSARVRKAYHFGGSVTPRR